MKIYFTKLAYLQLLIEVKKYNHIETGAILVGRVIENNFYVFESLDSGINCRRGPAIFYRDNPYSEHLVDVVRAKYENATAIGFWHRHPGDFNQFSSADLTANINMARILNKNIISGLVNIFDGQIKLKFWCITLDNNYEEGQIIIGDDYFRNILFYKEIDDIKNLILKNELDINIKEKTKDIFTNDTIVKTIESENSQEIKQISNKKSLFEIFKRKTAKANSSNKDINILNLKKNPDIESQIFNEIKLDIEILSGERIICQKYVVSDDFLYKDKVFLTFINLINNKECDVVLYYLKQELVFYVLGTEYKYIEYDLLKHIKRLLIEEEGNGKI